MVFERYFVLCFIFVISQPGIYTVTSKEFVITCMNDDGDIITKPKFATPNASIYYLSVEVIFCHNPSTVYNDMLQMLHLKMPRTLTTYLRNGTTLRPDQFKGLQVEELDIHYVGINNIFNGEILPNLTSVKELQLQNAVITPLPATTIKKLHLWNGKSAGNIGNCENLEELYLYIWNVTQIPKNWLMNCTKLFYLSLKGLDVKAVEKILAGPNSIKKLEISECGLLSISSEFVAMLTGVKELYLYNNIIKRIWIGQKYPRLETLDLRNNEITDLHEVMTFLKTQNDSLVSFAIDKNRVLDICPRESRHFNSVFTKVSPLLKILDGKQPFRDYWNALSMRKLKRLTLADTGTSKLCMRSINAPSLEFLDLSNIKITSLEFRHLPLRFATYLKEIKLDNTPIKTVDFGFDDFGALLQHRQQLKITGINMTVDCDCANWLLATAIKHKLMILEAYCDNDHKRLEQMPLEKLECDKYNCEACICRKSLKFKNVTAYCNGEQTRILQEANLTTLIAPGNLIVSFNDTVLTNDLVKLDLRKNHIARLDANVVNTLFNVSERRVNLSGNPIVCDCDNVPLLEALKNHRNQVEDYKNITCVDDDRGLDELDFEELCTKPLDSRIMISSFFLLGFSAALAIITALYLKFERQIKVFLYARGCCFWWISEEELDADRPFDAFISFAHEDEEFVMVTLLPELEQCGYKLCVHNRNWIVGEWIPTQITRSLEMSRRTIFIISKNFFQSVWGLLEFRLAHLSSLQEGRLRMLMLLLEDVDDVKMDDELRGYIKNNTYVKWGERWFWDKLKYSLPHRSKLDANFEMQMSSPIMVGPTGVNIVT